MKPGPRPNPARELADARGEHTFQGPACHKHGGTARYVSNGKKVCCQAFARKTFCLDAPVSGSAAEEIEIPPEFIRERQRELQARALRLAAGRAEKTAYQRRCLGLPA